MFSLVRACVDGRISVAVSSVEDSSSVGGDDWCEATLTIGRCESVDSGCYAVQLDNEHGTERMYSSVTVEGLHAASCDLYTRARRSRAVSVLDSGAEEPGFKWQPRRCRVTVLGKLFTPIVPHQAAKLAAALLRVAGVTAGLAESNGSLPPGL